VIPQVQVVANTLLTFFLAFCGSTLEEMILATLVMSNSNLWLKKAIDGQTPVGLKMLYNHMRSEVNNIPNVILYMPSSCLSVSPLGSSSALSSWLNKDGHLLLLSSPSRKKNQELINLMIEAMHQKY
jgi:hypothetical protein